MLLAVAQSLVPCGELVQAGPQVLLVGDEPPVVALGGSVLAERGAGPSLGGPEALLAAVDRPPATLRAQKFPRATSFSMSMSRAWSATIFLSLVFSLRSVFSSTMSSGRMEWYWAFHRW